LIPYILLLTLTVLAWLVSKKYRFTVGEKVLYRTKSGCIDVFMLILVLLLAFRGLSVGNDTMQYQYLFREYGASTVAELYSREGSEFGYRLLCKLIYIFTDNYQILLSITTLLCICPIWYFYKRESEHPLLTVALFLTVAPFVMYFSGIRQAIAMGIGIPMWFAAKRKKPVVFILLLLLALQMHSSAFMLVLLYPLYHAKITPRWLWAVIPVIVLVFIYRTPIFTFLVRFLWKEYEEATETGATTVLVLLIVFAIYAYVIPDESKLDRDTLAMRNLLLLSVMLQIFAMLHPLSMRMNYYYLIFVPVLMPRLAARCKHKYEKIAKLSTTLMTAFFFGLFLKDMITDNDGLNIFPYIPFWKNP